MKKKRDYLYIFVFTLMTLLITAAAFKLFSVYLDKRAAEDAERQMYEAVLVRNAESQRRILEMESEIAEMAYDAEGLQKFIDEIVAAAQKHKEMTSVSENDTGVYSASVSGNETVSGNSAAVNAVTVSGNATISGNSTVSGNLAAVSAMAAAGNATVSGNSTVSGNQAAISAMTVSGNTTVSGNSTVSGNTTISGNSSVSGNLDPFGIFSGGVSGSKINFYDASLAGSSIFDEWSRIYEPPEMTLQERRALRTSYEETLEVNQADREWIAENEYDFSQMKIACLGDSITAATNLEKEENYLQYSYPERLKELLGAAEVVNLGIGGSSIGRYWADPFVERYMQIPEDTDIIIVLGGTNDGFCVSDNEFGNLADKTGRTFCGDLDELVKGLKNNYPEAVIFLATPLPNILHDYLMSEQDYLLPQNEFADAMRIIAAEYGIELVDLYNSNILDSHDANIVAEYLPDGVHGNPAGYQILAEHFAAEIVKYYN